MLLPKHLHELLELGVVTTCILLLLHLLSPWEHLGLMIGDEYS